MATAAERVRRYRDRKRRGVLAVVPVEVTQETVDAFVECGGIEADEITPENLGDCVQSALDMLVEDLRGEES